MAMRSDTVHLETAWAVDYKPSMIASFKVNNPESEVGVLFGACSSIFERFTRDMKLFSDAIDRMLGRMNMQVSKWSQKSMFRDQAALEL